MAQQENQKPASAPKEYGEAKEEKDFFAREEVRTMEKDISKLRETEAHQERERVAKIKTGEEILREKQREELAKTASQERALAEKQAKEREERIKNMRQAPPEQTAETQTEKAPDFKNALRETQEKEEQARKQFLDRVEARAEGNAEKAALSPLPPISPPVQPPIPETSLRKPGAGQKLWIRIILSLLILSILAVAGTFTYWYFFVRQEEPNIESPANQAPEWPEQKESIVPPALFQTESSQTITAPLISQALQEPMEQGLTKRIVIKDIADNNVLGLKDFFDFFLITAPENFYDKVADEFTFFVYSQGEGNRLGLVVKIDDEEGLNDLMLSWEETMESDLQNFFELLDKTEPALVAYFRDAEYQEAGFRFQTFSRQDVGIVYAIFDDYFILTTSWKSMEKALDKLKEEPLSLEEMTLAEKIGQLFFIGINGTTLTEETESLMGDILPGGVLLLKKNIVDKEQTKKLISGLQAVSLKNSGIPLFIGVDQEGGQISPVNFLREKTAQSDIKTAEQAYAVGLSRGEELRELGITLNLAPVLDAVQPGDFVFTRAFQTNQSQISDLVKSLISGQKMASILTAIKHFPGYGSIAFDPEDKLAVLDETPQINLFKTAAEVQPEFIMTSNVVYAEIDPDLPFSFSPEGIKLVRQNIGSGPLIMTDDLPQQSLIDTFSLKGVVVLPIKAGVDILTFSNNWGTTLRAAVSALETAVQEGEIPQAQIDDSVLKILKLKEKYYN